MSAPILSNEVARLRSLHDLQVLDTPLSPGFQRLCEIACDVFLVPIALISFVDADRQWFKARRGLEMDCTDRGSAFCSHAIAGEDVFVVSDATKDARFATSCLVSGGPRVRFYAGAPLSIVPGLRIGTLCIMDDTPRGLAPAERRLLRKLADLGEDELRLHQLQEQSRRSERQRRIAESAMQSGSWERDLQTGRSLWSNGLFDLFEQNPATAAPDLESVLPRVHPEDRPILIGLTERARNGEDSFAFDVRFQRLSGEQRLLETRAHVVRDDEGRPLRITGIVTDVTDRRRATAELAIREERYEALTKASSTILWNADANGGFTEGWGWTDFTGQPLEEARGSGWLACVHPADLEHVSASTARALQQRSTYECEHRLRTADGGYRWVLARGVPLRREDGTVREWVGTTSDIHERREAAETLRRSEQRLKLALTAGRMVAWDMDPTTGAFLHSGNAREIYGIDSRHYVAYSDRIHSDDAGAVKEAIERALPGEMAQVDCRFLRPDGEIVWLEIRFVKVGSGDHRRIVGVTFDITARKQAEEQIWRVANHDALTNLGNRSFFAMQLEEALRAGDPAGSFSALFLIDVDDFKGVNDTLGHDAGDVLLREMAKRLRSMLRDGDLVARLGGDEFAVLVKRLRTRKDAVDLCGRILTELRRPYAYGEQVITSRASAGIAFHPDHHTEPAELMKDADMALYAAKAQGRNRAVVYNPELRCAIERRVSVAAQIRSAIPRQQIVPYYQPIVSLSSGAVEGFEALARWHHPERGLLTPGAFKSVFDDRELACAIGESMLRQVVADLATWRGQGVGDIAVSVNLSLAELVDPDLVERFLAVLAASDGQPDQVIVEVTESVFLGPGSERVGATLQSLKRHGVRIALDDFGTGYASLIHLKQFPVDAIKIDRSFVRDVLVDPDDAAIVTAVIGLGASLGMRVIAEGVEMSEQAALLRSGGCDYGQGYLFARPMPAKRVPMYLSDWGAGGLDLRQSVA